MKIGDLGEFGLIARIARGLPESAPGIVLGIGDDVAVLETPGDEYLLATCDIQVEGVHFLSGRISPRDLGRKCVAVNVSDIASMGGAPTHALVSLALPPDTDVAFVDDLYAGMREEISRAGAAIVGGNMSKSLGGVMIDVFLMGRVARGRFLSRRGALVGDAVCVTGAPGDSRAGLALVLDPARSVSGDVRARVLAAHLTPTPRLAEGQAIAASGFAHAMIDVSDGVLSDLRHICGASGVGAEVDAARLPVSEAERAVARAAGADPLDWALRGGEDYELLFTAAPADAERLCAEITRKTGTPCTVIGRILSPDSALRVLLPGGPRPFETGSAGFDHFGERT